MKPAPIISVVICTFNRCSQLSEMLESLGGAAAMIKEQFYEIIVIDNNSSDQTRKVVEQHRTELSIRYVFEPLQGLSHARNRALRVFTGDWLLFTDDDVVLDSNWLQSYLNLILNQTASSFIGGRIVPLWREPAPRWLQDEDLAFFPGLLMKYDLGTSDRSFDSTDPIPFGASFAICRPLVEAIGKFRTDLGVTGNVPARGEETEYLTRAMKHGFSGYYCGQSLCHHVVDQSRLSLRFLYQFGVQKGIAATRTTDNTAQSSSAAVLGFALRGAYQLLKGRGDRARQCLINIGIQRGIRLAS
ncbi:MAG: glycosyltransferase family 2 protein [bacterium]